MPPLLLTHCASYDNMSYGNRIPNGLHDWRGACKAQGSKANPTSQVNTALSK
jgi:hypothetical protein